MYKGDLAPQLAHEFCQKHSFDEDTQQALERQLQEKMDRVAAAVSDAGSPRLGQQSRSGRWGQIFEDYKKGQPNSPNGLEESHVGSSS